MEKKNLKDGITIVIPVKDREKLIGRALDSVLRQTCRPERVIVVDNGSKDATVEEVRNWVVRNKARSNLLPGNEISSAELTLDMYEEKEPGAAAARNRGLEEVETEWVYFFDSDDEMLPSLCEDALTVAGDADLVFWKLLTVAGNRYIEKPYSRHNIARRHLFNGLLSTQAFMVRTSFVRQVGGWDAKAMAWNDWELGFRLLLARPRITSIARPEAIIHPQDVSITGTAFSHKTGVWENTLGIMDATIEDLPEDAPLGGVFKGYDKKRLHGMIDYRRIILSALYKKEGATENARTLLDKTLGKYEGSPFRQFLLRLIWRYTASGGRAAYLLWH